MNFHIRIFIRMHHLTHYIVRGCGTRVNAVEICCMHPSKGEPWITIVDRINVVILRELRSNCRISLREIAKKCKLSAPAIKRRIRNLEQSDIIVKYVLQYSLAMVKAIAILFEVFTDGSEDVIKFVEQIGINTMISEVCWGGVNEYIIFGYYIDIEDAFFLMEQIRNHDFVNAVKTYPLLLPRGESKQLTRIQTSIVQELLDEPRLSPPDIASKVDISTKTARKNISSLNGKILQFSINWNPSGHQNLGYIIKLQLIKETKMAWILDTLQNTSISTNIWETYRCAIEPILFLLISTQTNTELKDTMCKLRSIQDISRVSMIKCVSWHTFPNLRQMKL